jgi:nonsense-mediated mRNA decay protein 3
VQCFRCGKDHPESRLISGLCADCFVETQKPVVIPEHITVLVCASCGSVLRGKSWLKTMSPEELIEHALDEHTAVREGVEVIEMAREKGKGDDRSFDLKLHAKFKVAGKAFEHAYATHIKVRHSLCDVCSRRAGSYFEAIIQVRAFDGPLADDHRARIRTAVEDGVERIAANEREVFLTKADEVHGGLDFYLSSTTAAQRIANVLRDELGATLLRSGKIAGVKDGNELQRVTISVRLPKFIRNDVLVAGERVFRVTKVHAKTIVVADLDTGVQENKGEDWIKKALAPGAEAARADAVVVSVANDEIQVLDPLNYSTVTLRNWPRHEPGLDKVPVVRFRGRIYLTG